MPRSLSRPRVLGALALLFAAACSPAAPVVKTPPKTTPTATPRPPVVSPAQWILHPSTSLTMRARFDLGTAGVVYAGEGGERWLDKRDGGVPVAAASLLPDGIVAIQRSHDGATRFVAASGVVYDAKEPLGAATASKAPPKKARDVAAGKESILVVAVDGTMQRSTDAGATWAEVAVLPGVSGTLVRVAMLPTGQGLALYAPQKVAVTTDDGATWAPIATPGVGARKLLVDVNGDLLLEGVEDSAIFRDSPPHLEKIHRAPTIDYELTIPPDALHPALAEAVDQGHAMLVEDRYIEAVQDADAGGSSHWSLVIGPFGKPGTSLKVPTLDGCEMVYVGGDATTLEIGCDHAPKSPASTTMKKPKVDQRWHIELYKSTDGGKTLTPDGSVVSADREDKHLFLGPDGTLVIDGGCKRTKSEWSCEDSPPVVRPPGAKDFAKVTGVPNTRFKQLFFAEGGKAYALGYATDSQRTALYISIDGGKDFRRKWLPAVTREDHDVDAVQATPFDSGAVLGAMTLDGNTVRILTPDGSSSWLSFSTSDDGATFESHVLPLEDIDNLGLSGKHAFAFDQSGKGYESSDGGVTWGKVAAPRGGDVRVSVACGGYGCLIGDRATRIGWDGTGAPLDGGIVDTPKTLVSASTLKCTVDEKEPWKTLGTTGIPTASNADIGGGVGWVTSRQDVHTGAVEAVVGVKGAKGLEVKTISLFPAEAGSPEYASKVSMQLEGVAAMRFAFKRDPIPPTSKAPKGVISQKQMVDVDVAWYVAATGKVSRGTIKNVGPLDPARDVADGMWAKTVNGARPPLLSIGIGGLHVRPLNTVGGPLWWVSESGKVDKLTWPDLPKTDVHGNTMSFTADAGRIGKRSIVFGTLTGGVQLWSTWASEGGGAWEPHTWGLWPELSEAGDLRVRYVDSGAIPGLAILYSGNADTPSSQWLVQVDKPSGDPSSIVALPSQASFADKPPACDKSAWNVARVMLPYKVGTRHPLVVDGAPLMATSSAIVRVTDAKTWCASAYDATALSATGSEHWSAIVAVDDLENSSLFREGADRVTSVRPMKCAYTADKPPSGITPGIDGFGK